METLSTLKKVIDCIEQNLSNENLSINFLAKKLYFSPFYFQRFFNANFGVSVGVYIRERRLTEAGTDIKNGCSILDVAIKYCYESQQAFTRAFKSFHGVNPGQAKKGVILSCRPKINIEAFIKGNIKMDVKIEKEQAFTIAVLERKFNTQTSNQEVPKFWDEFYEKGYQNIVPPMLGVCIDLGEQAGLSEGEFIYGIGSIKEYCTEIPEGFKTYNVPAHLWGKFYTKGKMPETIQNLWAKVFDWVQENNYRVIPGFDFECYTEGDVTSDDYVSGIWVALEEK